jgi:hypothetical protein
MFPDPQFPIGRVAPMSIARTNLCFVVRLLAAMFASSVPKFHILSG